MCLRFYNPILPNSLSIFTLYPLYRVCVPRKSKSKTCFQSLVFPPCVAQTRVIFTPRILSLFCLFFESLVWKTLVFSNSTISLPANFRFDNINVFPVISLDVASSSSNENYLCVFFFLSRFGSSEVICSRGPDWNSCF